MVRDADLGRNGRGRRPHSRTQLDASLLGACDRRFGFRCCAPASSAAANERRPALPAISHQRRGRPHLVLMIRGTKLYALVAFSALAFTVLIALGLWQLERREWKRTLLADLERALSPSAQALALDAAEPLLKDRDYIRVKLQGRFDHAQERYIFAVLEGQTGAQVITPFITDDRRLVVVNR